MWEKYESVILPLRYNPLAVRRIHDMFHCERCGACCRDYENVSVTQEDCNRAPEIIPYVTVTDGRMSTKGGCPFLTDEGCSIYERRPDTCWLYPLQSPITYGGDERMVIRLKCEAARNVVQEIYESEKCQLEEVTATPVSR